MKNHLNRICLTLSLCLISLFAFAQRPVRIGIDGMVHGHVHGALQTMADPNAPIKIVGIAEPNKELAQRYATMYGFDMSLVYNTVEEMIKATKPQGVMAFNSIYDHLSTVEACAPKGIHVMVEKPLAVNMEHATKMAALAGKHNIMLLTNYETTWYPSNYKAYDFAQNKTIGDIRKMIICDGHQGPIELGCEKEFTTWLTDPVLNGGGAVIDFGCYGANLATWMMKNERPISVSATLKQIKPDVYPKVDDDATIIVTYPKSEAIIQGSWNWPFSRKDMEIYGAAGYIKALTADSVSYRLPNEQRESAQTLPEDPSLFNNPFSYFDAAIRGAIIVNPQDLSSLQNNMIVVEILDAARESAKTGKTIQLTKK